MNSKSQQAAFSNYILLVHAGLSYYNHDKMKFLEQKLIQRGVSINLSASFQLVKLTLFGYNEFTLITFLLLSRCLLVGHRKYVTGRNRILSPSSPAIITYLHRYDPQVVQCTMTVFALFFVSSRIGHLCLVWIHTYYYQNCIWKLENKNMLDETPNSIRYLWEADSLYLSNWSLM